MHNSTARTIDAQTLELDYDQLQEFDAEQTIKVIVNPRKYMKKTPQVLETQEQIEQFWSHLPMSNGYYHVLDINQSLANNNIATGNFQEARENLRTAYWAAKEGGYFADYQDQLEATNDKLNIAEFENTFFPEGLEDKIDTDARIDELKQDSEFKRSVKELISRAANRAY